MKLLKVTKAKQIILNEIVATLEFIDYLKFEAVGSVKSILKREQEKKQRLVAALEYLD